ncbi:type 2 DNA topoisomerase 6 subunit B [Candidatus Methanoplasma termitum]|uniref:Type 2 DNA topoisomerase 6 subunit B n=1 Tax=Candidatus Methanoplasma termitum TaxID=1577791 RepID=A0A0A7LC77_9ARCH|nr:DNA topoisomerase VI subunit B [Candidatus Methanoplasma termitum]AIZ56664.1 type 2 DNA topoisomerase 6 subunit B [Candidatus Methanoplasma termitum]
MPSNNIEDYSEGNTQAHKMAAKQQEISVTEFFEKNKHILGFDSRSKSLMMGIKEAVDNSLDACEEAGFLPDIYVRVERLQEEEEYRITVEDNGPGIIHKMIPNVFGRLLYGSRFHALRQSRGQQGIGISATVMYGNISTGKPAHVESKIEGKDEVAWKMDITIDTKTNRPIVKNDVAFIWEGKDHGTKIEYTTKGRYITGKQSIFEYLRNTAIVNPHTKIEFHDPEGKKYIFERATEQMPPKSKEIKPHPEGMEIGDLMKYTQNTQQKTVNAFLKNDFSRITERIADEILTKAGVDPSMKPSALSRDQCKAILSAITQVKIMAPQTDCLSPIGDTLIKKGLMHVLDGLRPDYYATPVSRSPKSVNGNPFIVEAGIVYGGEIPSDDQVTILRFANRVPLLYQQGACAITKAISEVDWRRYGLEQRGGKGIPFGPAIILVHVASTKVPFTSEGKEAIASFAELQSEIEQALRLCARNLKSHLNKMERKTKTGAKFQIVQEIIPAIAKKSSAMLNRPMPDLSRTISKIMNVVWIKAEKKKDPQKGFVITYTIHNYTTQERTIGLHTHLPKSCANLTLFSNPYFVNNMTDDGKVMWEVKNIQPSTSLTISFELKGELADTFDADDVYISGINPVLVMGAEALPGDWGIKGLEIIESDENIPADDEEEETEAEDLGDE